MVLMTVFKHAYTSSTHVIVLWGCMGPAHCYDKQETGSSSVPVRRRVCKYYGGTSGVTSLLNNTGLEQLVLCCVKSPIAMMYRKVNDLVDIPAKDQLLQAILPYTICC